MQFIKIRCAQRIVGAGTKFIIFLRMKYGRFVITQSTNWKWLLKTAIVRVVQENAATF
jgi:ABC-type glucose/galactose transport system permease subunit